MNAPITTEFLSSEGLTALIRVSIYLNYPELMSSLDRAANPDAREAKNGGGTAGLFEFVLVFALVFALLFVLLFVLAIVLILVLVFGFVLVLVLVEEGVGVMELVVVVVVVWLVWAVLVFVVDDRVSMLNGVVEEETADVDELVVFIIEILSDEAFDEFFGATVELADDVFEVVPDEFVEFLAGVCVAFDEDDCVVFAVDDGCVNVSGCVELVEFVEVLVFVFGVVLAGAGDSAYFLVSLYPLVTKVFVFILATTSQTNPLCSKSTL